MADDFHAVDLFRRIARDDQLITDRQRVCGYAVDGILPKAVLFPESIEQLAGMVSLASQENLALVPWGSGSKMGIGNPPSRLDLVLCTERLKSIIDMDTANLTVTVQAGARFREVQQALAGEENRCYLPVGDFAEPGGGKICSDRAHKGCFIPLWPLHASTATMGGIIAAKSSGPMRLLYGQPRDLLLGVRYVAATGEVIGMGGKTVKNVSGYDICKLLVGSAGSLGILCEMTLRLLPLPESRNTGLFFFNGLEEASDFVEAFFRSGMFPAAVEIINRRAWETLALQEAEAPKAGKYLVAVALEGFAEAVDRMASEAGRMARESHAIHEHLLGNEAHGLFWDSYSNIASYLYETESNTVSIKMSYPISRYGAIIRDAEGAAEEYQLGYAFAAHAGSGICYLHLFMGRESSATLERAAGAIRKLMGCCGRAGGNVIVQKALPKLKQMVPVWGLPREDLVVMKRIKEEMDSQGIFSPGRFVGGI